MTQNTYTIMEYLSLEVLIKIISSFKGKVYKVIKHEEEK